MELSLLVPFLSITDNRQQAAEHYLQAWQIAEFLRPEQLVDSPHSLIGTVDQIVEDLQTRREHYSFSYIVVFEHNMAAFAPVVARLTRK